MKFKAYKFENDNVSFDQNILKKAFNFLIHRNEEVSIFSHEKISDGIQHIVFHIPDEHISGTKKGGIDSNLPFSQFINVFIFNKVIFLELIKKNYLDIILNFLKENYKLYTTDCNFENSIMKESIKHYNGRIKQLDLSTSDGDIVDNSIELLETLDFSSLSEEYSVDFIAFQPNDNAEHFISLDTKGITGLKLSNEEAIFNWLKYLESQID